MNMNKHNQFVEQWHEFGKNCMSCGGCFALILVVLILLVILGAL